MEKKIFAFSFVEIIVVVAILIVLSSSSVFYFTKFFDWRDIESDILWLQTVISDYNLKVKQNKLYDYEINFVKWDFYSIIKENVKLKGNWSTANFSYWSKLLTLKSNQSSTWTWNIKIKNNYKTLVNDYREQSGGTYTWKLNMYKEYYIKSLLDWDADSENFFFSYYSEQNIDWSGVISLSNINTKENKTWTSIFSWTLKNINNKISFWSGGVSEQKDVYLFFSKDWNEKVLKIK